MSIGVLTFVGFVMGTGFSILLAFALLSGNEIPSATGAPVDPSALVAAYIVGGAAGGFLAGLVWKLRSSVWGTALAGVLFMFPMTLGVAWVYWDRVDAVGWPIVAGASVLAGIPMGFILRKQYRDFLADVPDQIRDWLE